jgi:hypothetical protein
MSGIEKSADFPGISPILALESSKSASYPIGTAHDAFIDALTTLLNRLVISDDAKASESKRVVVRGALYHPITPGVKFSVEFRGGKVQRVRIMMIRDEDEDKAAVPAEFGGTGLMAAGGAGADEEPAPKRKRKAAVPEPEPETLVSVLAKAIELARLNNDSYAENILDQLLKIR